MRRLQASLLGGLFIGVLSGLPIVAYGNACCCLWVVLGGLLTTWLRQQAHESLEPTDVALAGLLAGVAGAIITVAMSAMLFFFTGDLVEQEMQRVIEQYPQLPPDVRDRLMALTSGPGLLLLTLFVSLPAYAVFAMAGALLGLLFFRKPQPPPVVS